MNKQIAIFASGSGSNAKHLMQHFAEHKMFHVTAVFTNKTEAGVVSIAQEHRIPCFHFDNKAFQTGEKVLAKLQDLKIDYIVLAGFLRKIPTNIIQAYSDKIINIHPSLLPKHGGQNMYGKRVHEAVLASGDQESGITIHLVNEEYDKGRIIAQHHCPVLPSTTLEELMQSVQALEHQYYKLAIEKFMLHV